MPSPGEANPPRLSAEDAFLDLLTETLESVDSGARGQFLQRFFKSIADVELGEKQSLEVWDQTLARRRDLTESLGRKVLWQAALIDVLASADLVRLPILM